MNLLTAIKVLEQAKSRFKIPNEADLTNVDKMVIEKSTFGEMESLESREIDRKKNAQHLGDKSQEMEGARIIAWVGRFDLDAMFWELAIDMDGTLVRLRKSRSAGFLDER
jgi:hypothetical protein